MTLKTLVLLLCLLLPSLSLAIPAEVYVCFTPGERCDLRIIEAIAGAKNTIMVEAYQLTSKPIESALVDAYQRGVKVQVILDKSQVRTRGYSPSLYFHNMKVPTWIDNKPAIAHNKVMIIDGDKVITGSYNYSRSAQYRNAENMVIIISSQIASQYQRNFDYRLSQSVKI
jgi:phosphatidylserine/phosphatidylglycerophosphate/cardiolipin synthase-like enzyme